MASLLNTDLAPVPVGKALYLFYQKDADILETHTEDGSAWTSGSAVVGDKAQPGGSPITAFYVNYDGTSNPTNPEAAIHVLYIDSDNAIRERVKVISKGVWEERAVPAEFVKSAVQTSRISSGYCHVEKIGAHQWLFYVRQKEGNFELVELRSGDASHFKWTGRKDLPQGRGAVLPGATIATSLTNPTTHLYFQDHDYKVHEFRGTYESWDHGNTVLDKGEVEISTPLATCDSDTKDQPHLFYVDNAATKQIRDYQAKKAPIGPFYPGTKLGAAVFQGKPHLFYRELQGTYGITTKVFDGTKWVQGSHVL
ncbi:protein kinase ssp1 [Arachnomyces sp. PD_36]|nr:protein kinase ssp1 [Arachnomyces sp. PD_36]